MSSRRRFTTEYKQEAVQLLTQCGVTVAQAARDLGLNPNLLRKWIREQAADPVHAFPGEGRQKPGQTELARLRREVATLKMEHDILKKARPTLLWSRCECTLKFGFVAKNRVIWPVEFMCEALGVSRSGFYAWLTRVPSARSVSDAVVGVEVHASFVASDRAYRARRVWRDVLDAGHSSSLHKIERLMRVQALRARPRRRARPLDTGIRHAASLAPNILDRQFRASAPNRKWVADFTFMWTAEGGLYVAVVLDLYSRRVVGWSMQSTMTSQLVRGALTLAVSRAVASSTWTYCIIRTAGVNTPVSPFNGSWMRSASRAAARETCGITP
jgi:putative transposase